MGIFLHPSLLFFLRSLRVLQRMAVSENFQCVKKGNCYQATGTRTTLPLPLLTVRKVSFCFESLSTFQEVKSLIQYNQQRMLYNTCYIVSGIEFPFFLNWANQSWKSHRG